MATGASHLDLMVAVGLIRDAARHGDVDGLHVALCRLRNDLAGHVTVEALAVEELSGAAADSVRRGQRHLLAFVDGMLADSDSDTGCACIVRAAELRGLLIRQIRLEAVLGTRHEPARRAHSERWRGR
jgi:hypothetical protein